MHVKNDIGIVEQREDTSSYQFETNTGADDHKGVEAYVELNVLGGLVPNEESEDWASTILLRIQMLDTHRANIPATMFRMRRRLSSVSALTIASKAFR